MRITNRIVTMLATLAVLFGLTTVSASANEPVVSTPTYGESTFAAVDHVVTTAELKTKSGHKTYLNVQAQPMTRKQIQPGSCEQWPVGTWFWNEVIDPATGKRMFKRMRVQPGDNTFCVDRQGVTRKKSCGNEARKDDNPPPKRLRIKGKINVADYIQWVAEQTQKVTKTGSALASVKTETCEARATVDNTVFIDQRYRVVFKSRTMSEAQAEGARRITITARNDQVVKGTLETQIYLNIKGQASAWCKTTTTSEEHDECPYIPGNQPEGYECETPPPPPPVTGDIICASPPHLYFPNGNGLVFCEMTRSDGAMPSLSQFSIEGLNDHAHFAQPTETPWRDDSTLNPCPAKTLCVRIQVWADSVGLFKYRAKFSNFDQVDGSIDIKPDEF